MKDFIDRLMLEIERLGELLAEAERKSVGLDVDGATP